MKKIFVLLLLNIFCTVNSQVVNLYSNPNYGSIYNAYFKDIDNFQNQFIGTWVYQNGQERLEIKFRKLQMALIGEGPRQYYEDVLVGEYKYIDATGVEKVNSIPLLENYYETIFKYNLYSGGKMTNSSAPICNVCPPGTERLYMFFDEQGNDDFGLSAAFTMRRVVENGVEKIIAQLENVSQASNENKENVDQPSLFRHFSVPYGFYTLIKQ